MNFSPLVALLFGAILKTEKAVLLTVHMLVVFNMEEDKDGLKSRFLIGQIIGQIKTFDDNPYLTLI